MVQRRINRLVAVTALLALSLSSVFSSSAEAAGASLKFSPTQGQYYVDSTFDVAVVVDTGGQAINAVEVHITFPPDKLQVVSPVASPSFVEIWTTNPSYSNTAGTIDFQGGLPNPGINTSAGVISTIKFRAKSSGKAVLKFSDNSKILANDGVGENILTSLAQSIHTYTLSLAPPNGPVVSSPTHEDQNNWYKARSIVFQWEDRDGISGYSYLLDTAAASTPELKAITTDTETSQTVSTDGIWYFHIMAQNKEGSWGGITHFMVRIDSTPPAVFKPGLDETVIKTGSRPVVRFNTTDSASGIDHYELKIINKNEATNSSALFIEESSPFQLPSLNKGNYSIVVRAFDGAGNTTDGVADFRVTDSALLPAFVSFINSNWVKNAISTVIVLSIVVWLWYLFRLRKHRLLSATISRDLAQLKADIHRRQAELGQLIGNQSQIETQIQPKPSRAESSSDYPPNSTP